MTTKIPSRLKRKKARGRAISCANKVRYECAQEAKDNPYSQDSYACKFCGGWHLTGAIYKNQNNSRKFNRKTK